MDGLLLIDKPQGLTSHQVIEIIRQKLKIKKVGHAGTLDPLATGLLVIMLGKTTKLSNSLISQNKSYQVEIELFIETDSGDITGKIIKTEQTYDFEQKKLHEVINAFNEYTYWQTPPLYSAIKIKGKKLYEYARKGEKITIPPRKVTIEKIKLLSYFPQTDIVVLTIECSKGTYIRSLVSDIAVKLGTIATVTKLRRISSGDFQISQAITLEEISENKIIPEKLIINQRN